MSDFDEEAERERLREKYEQDKKERQATEQMSELLLKGATMTNAHCSDCGDPIFRYDGTEFCPTCQKEVDRSTGEDDTAAGVDDAGAVDASASDDATTGDDATDETAAVEDRPTVEVTDPSDDVRVSFGGQSVPENGDNEGPGEDEGPDEGDAAAADDAEASENPAARDETAADPDAGAAGAGGTGAGSTDPAAPADDLDESIETPSVDPSADRTGDESTSTQPSGSAAHHLGRAQVSLARTVERFAAQAEAAETPREAREHLEAAREAAAALDATDF